MASKEAGEKLKQTFNWMEVNGRCIVCRFCKEGEEENFIPDSDIKSGLEKCFYSCSLP